MTAGTGRYAVQKYGGTSVATPERLHAVAARVAAARERHDGVVVVVSAMGDTTDRLIELAHRVSDDPPAREMDQLLSSGEIVTAPLLAMALHARGVPAVSLSGPQAGIHTSTAHRRARIVDIVPERVLAELDAGRVVVVAGFQGVTEVADITTLGRGGSDTTAVALGVALHAVECEICTDVDGVYTADPRAEPRATLLDEISYEEMLELAAVGARVMHPRAVEIGEAYGLPIRVRSAFGEGRGTLIHGAVALEQRQRVRGVAHEVDVAKLTVLGVPDRPGIAAAVFGALAARGVNVDIIVQNVSHAGHTDMSFTVRESDLREARAVVDAVAGEIGAAGVETSADVAKVTVVGTGLLNTPGMIGAMFGALAAEGINIQMISTSEIRVTCIIDRDRVYDAVRALHAAYQLENL